MLLRFGPNWPRRWMMEVPADTVPATPVQQGRLLVCLGNPGARYAETRHNAGWQVAAAVLARADWRTASWQPAQGELFQLQDPGASSFLLKPLTFMNDSGSAVLEVIEQFSISPRELLVICDCLDLPLGALRLRRRGSSGGHNGVASIIMTLGTEDFPRLRVGIGRPEPGVCEVVDYVLSDWVSAEKAVLTSTFALAAELTYLLREEGWQSAVVRLSLDSADRNNANQEGEHDIGKV